MVGYVVFEQYVDEIPAVFYSRADAEEFILALCEECVYEVMMTGDPKEMFGTDYWDWRNDYVYLMWDAGRSFTIIETFIQE